MSKIAVIMGSHSDSALVQKTLDMLDKFNISYTSHIISAHRKPDELASFVKSAKSNGYSVIIAAAGKAAALPGVIASHTTLPVIGIPLKSSNLDGIDSLLSIVQMPKGVPVATVAIDGVENAAILAAQILALSDETIANTLDTYKKELAK